MRGVFLMVGVWCGVACVFPDRVTVGRLPAYPSSFRVWLSRSAGEQLRAVREDGRVNLILGLSVGVCDVCQVS